MSKRYSSTKIYNRWDGKQVYKNTQYPPIYPSDGDIIIISSEGDTLDALAYKYYNDPSLWFIIALCNNLGKGRLSVTPGLQIRIPNNINKILNDMNNMNKT